MIRKILTLAALLAAFPLFADTASLPSANPRVMLGAVDMREATVWVQTRAPGQYTLCYAEADAPAGQIKTSVFETNAKDNRIAKVTLGPLTPGKAYRYWVEVGEKSSFSAQGVPANAVTFKTPANYRDRTPPPEFTVAFGGGHYDNDPDYDPPFKTPGGDYAIFTSILAQKPDVMFWLGDNVILREGDRGSRSGILARYEKARSTAEMQPLLASVPNLAIWGAGETANGDSYVWNLEALKEAFRLNWANPSFGVPNVNGNVTQFRWNDAEFFLLDDRTFRSQGDAVKSVNAVFGKDQLDWLVEALARSDATFKVIVSNTSLLAPVDEKNAQSITTTERSILADALRTREIGGLIFISGGKAYGETTKFVRANASDLHDFNIGPLTARPDMAPSAINYLKVPGSTTRGHQFATLTFAGPEKDRSATITVFDAAGKPLYTQRLARILLK